MFIYIEIVKTEYYQREKMKIKSQRFVVIWSTAYVYTFFFMSENIEKKK